MPEQDLALRHAVGAHPPDPQATTDSPTRKGPTPPGETPPPHRLPHGLPRRRGTRQPARLAGPVQPHPDPQPELPQHLRQAVFYVRAGDLPHQVQGQVVLLVGPLSQLDPPAGESGGGVRQAAGQVGADSPLRGRNHHL